MQVLQLNYLFVKFHAVGRGIHIGNERIALDLTDTRQIASQVHAD